MFSWFVYDLSFTACFVEDLKKEGLVRSFLLFLFFICKFYFGLLFADILTSQGFLSGFQNTLSTYESPHKVQGKLRFPFMSAEQNCLFFSSLFFRFTHNNLHKWGESKTQVLLSAVCAGIRDINPRRTPCLFLK